MNSIQDVNKFKEWIKVDEGEDVLISSLISASRAIIKSATGLALEDAVRDNDLYELYETVQKILVNDLHEGEDMQKSLERLVGLMTQLEVYKLAQKEC